VVASSREILDNLVVLLGEAGRPLLEQTPLVVVNERNAAHARGLGLRRVLVAGGPSDEALVAAACAALAA
jgi:uroporphyrinogen-III synthase